MVSALPTVVVVWSHSDPDLAPLTEVLVYFVCNLYSDMTTHALCFVVECMGQLPLVKITAVSRME